MGEDNDYHEPTFFSKILWLYYLDLFHRFYEQQSSLLYSTRATCSSTSPTPTFLPSPSSPKYN